MARGARGDRQGAWPARQGPGQADPRGEAAQAGSSSSSTRSHTCRSSWSNNFGNAMYCMADLLSLYSLCGTAPSPPRGVLTFCQLGTRFAPTLRCSVRMVAVCIPLGRRTAAPRRLLGRMAMQRCYWAATAFLARLPLMIKVTAREQPCGLPPLPPLPLLLPPMSPSASPHPHPPSGGVGAPPPPSPPLSLRLHLHLRVSLLSPPAASSTCAAVIPDAA